MTKTLKDLQEENPDWCFKCGNPFTKGTKVHGYFGDVSRACECYEGFVITALVAAKREDEATIKELEALIQESSGVAGANHKAYESQLTAEQQAHAETRRQLEEFHGQHAWDRDEQQWLCTKDTFDAASEYLARQASINRPTDKQPTDDRGEGEK